MGLSEAEAQGVRDRVSFDLALKKLEENYTSFSTVSFTGVDLGAHSDWVDALVRALGANTSCTHLDLSGTNLSDGALQRVVAALATGATPQLRALDLRSNSFTLAGETMAQGVARLRPELVISLGDDATPTDGFVHDKRLVEGLSAWAAGDLASTSNPNDLTCPREISGGELIVLKKGFQGTNGTRYWCDLAEFELAHGTGSLVLKELKPEAQLRLAMDLGKAAEGGVVV